MELRECGIERRREDDKDGSMGERAAGEGRGKLPVPFKQDGGGRPDGGGHGQEGV